MYKLIITELANMDLDSIISYIAVQLANPTAVSDFLDEVERCYRYLKDNPMMYSKCSDKRLRNEGYRKAVIKNYILIYKVDETSKTVIVLRFICGARDYTKLI